jgi:hypothetical protein
VPSNSKATQLIILSSCESTSSSSGHTTHTSHTSVQPPPAAAMAACTTVAVAVTVIALSGTTSLVLAVYPAVNCCVRCVTGAHAASCAWLRCCALYRDCCSQLAVACADLGIHKVETKVKLQSTALISAWCCSSTRCTAVHKVQLHCSTALLYQTGTFCVLAANIAISLLLRARLIDHSKRSQCIILLGKKTSIE